jgi:hypothetical protein
MGRRIYGVMRFESGSRANMSDERTDGNEVDVSEAEAFWSSCSPPWILRRVMVASSSGAIEVVG